MTAPQRKAEHIGKEGCYFLSILYHAERIAGHTIDIMEAYDLAVGHGDMKPDCYMLDPARVMTEFSGVKWYVTHESPDYQTKPDELEILKFERPGFGHFVVGDGAGKVAFDPYGESLTVKAGKLASKRIFRRKP